MIIFWIMFAALFALGWWGEDNLARARRGAREAKLRAYKAMDELSEVIRAAR